MGPNDWQWHYQTTDDRQGPPPEDPAERAAREKAGMSRAMWKAMSKGNTTIDDYRRAKELDEKRAQKRRG